MDEESQRDLQSGRRRQTRPVHGPPSSLLFLGTFARIRSQHNLRLPKPPQEELRPKLHFHEDEATSESVLAPNRVPKSTRHDHILPRGAPRTRADRHICNNRRVEPDFQGRLKREYFLRKQPPQVQHRG